LNLDLVELLACPKFRHPVRLENASEEGGRVTSGRLVCTGCGSSYRVRDGIPRHEQKASDRAEQTARHFTVEFTADAAGDRDIDEAALVEFILHSRTGLDPNALKFGGGDWYPTECPSGYRADWSGFAGKIVLEGGCGPARFLPLVAPHCKRVIGLELGSHVERAANRCRHLDNVDLVQGSVLNPPFRQGAFDLVYSLGVLHHTERPGAGARALGSLVAPGGQISLWVYGLNYWGRGVRRLTGKAIHSALADRDPEDAYRLAKRWLYPLGRLQGRLARRRWTKLAAAPVFAISVPRHPVPEVMMATIFDYFAAPIISTHDDAEVRGWLEDAGLADIESLPVPTSVRATRPK